MSAMEGSVQLVSLVFRADSSPEADTAADHTSPGDRKIVMSKMSSEFAAPRKRSLTALPFVVSVLVMFNSVALPPCVEK